MTEPDPGGPHRIAVVGAGIAGIAAAAQLAGTPDVEVTVFERSDRIGGKLLTTPFAGLDAVDCAADAFLARVPFATGFARDVGLGDDLVNPERVGAAVWHDGLHEIPEGLVLGVPGNPLALATSPLLSWRAKARAALEPMLPRSATDHDSIGRFVRARFGDEVHEVLVDSLVGSIYAADTDRFSLAQVPQLAALAESRSVLLAARTIAKRSAGTASSGWTPVFAAPRGGMQQLALSGAEAVVAAGGTVLTGVEVSIEADGDGWRIDGRPFDAVIAAVPAPAAADLLTPLTSTGTSRRRADDGLITALRSAEHADVAMITLHVDADEWPDRLAGRSGYLVPKPDQRDVTAVSFASQKWGHWRPPAGGELLRVSIGRDGAPALHHSDDELVERALADLRRHLGVTFSPREVRVSRWPGAFMQYRPHHRRWADRVRGALPDGILLAGSCIDGLGVPSCIRSGTDTAQRAAERVRALA